MTGGATESDRCRQMAGQISMGARREITAAVSEHYRSAGWLEKGLILDELCKITGWHRKHAIRTLAVRKAPPPRVSPDAPLRREPTYGAIIKDALVALWEASDIAIVTGEPAPESKRSMMLWSERIVVALPDSHPLAANDVVYWTDLQRESASC